MYYSVQRTGLSLWKWRVHLDGARSLEGRALTRKQAKKAAIRAATRAAKPRPSRPSERASWRRATASPGDSCSEAAQG